MNTVLLIFDRLQAGYLGPYGNTWISTPAFNRLACGSLVLDQMYIDSPRLDLYYRALGYGLHALCPHDRPGGAGSLVGALREKNLRTALLTDDTFVADLPFAVECEEVVRLDPPWRTQTAEDVEQSHFGKCFVELIDWLQSAEDGFFLCCHFGGLGSTWDAPLDFRRLYRDEGDPEVLIGADVPELFLPENFDPDELLGMQQAYAGQVSLLDSCLDAFLSFFEKMPTAGETLLAVTSPRGFPLGEHRQVGPGENPLHEEILHVPTFLAFPKGIESGFRSQALAEPSDFWATLRQWHAIGGEVPSPTALSWTALLDELPTLWRDRLGMVGSREKAIRTPSWFFRNAGRGELYAKPDDRWEINNVSSRCIEVVDALHDSLVEFEQTLFSGSIADLPTLSHVLLHGLD